jgi:hypothetical protein
MDGEIGVKCYRGDGEKDKDHYFWLGVIHDDLLANN